jgi:hypothetical protein
MTATCRHPERLRLARPYGGYDDIDAPCGAPADPRSDPNDPRCAKHLSDEEK